MRKRNSSKGGEIEALLRKSNDLADQVEDDDYSGVEALLNQALAKDPNHEQALRHHAELLTMMGEDLCNEGKYAKALQCYGKATKSWRRLIRQNEECGPDIFYDAACCAALKGDVKQAVKYLAEAFALGFKNHPKKSSGLKRCEKDKGLVAIRDDQDYQKLHRQLKIELQNAEDALQLKRKSKPKSKPKPKVGPGGKVESSHPIRRFVHSDGRWINIAAVEGDVVQFSGTKESTVPYFGGVTENTFAPRAGRSAVEEMEKLAVDFKRRKYGEITPMKKVHISAGWIPISDDSGGDHLCVDLDPAEDGKVGQLFSYWHEYGAWRIVAPSFTVFLERLVKHLVRGRYAVNDKGQLAPLNGPAPEKVDQVLDYFLED